jgi:hypothetical protein
MAVIRGFAAIACVALLAACGNPPPSEAPATPAAAAAPGVAANAAPFMPVATVLELMESTIAHAAGDYWGAVTVVVDETGVHEHYPESAEEWEEVWAAAVTLAEAGNLLMMAPRAVDDGAWMRYARALVEVGVKAAEAAHTEDPEQIFAAGEEIYNVCTGCHMGYIPMPQ